MPDGAMTEAPLAPAASIGDRFEVEAFIFREARLADTSQYAEWESLVTDDFSYWVPCGPAVGDPADQLSYINDNRSRLATRIRQLRTGKRHAQTPVSRLARTISNIEIDGDTVHATQVVHELAVQAEAHPVLWPGRVTYRLRRVDGELRMAAKTVELLAAGEALPNLTFLL